MIDISQVPANTIAYTVVNQPPPVPPDIKWDNAEFWSKIFEDPMAISILNAVAKNMPVKIKTRVESWKDPNIHLASATTEETKKAIINRFTYVWQDFEFEVDEKNSILVKYNRGIESKELVTQKTSVWGALLMGLGFLVAFVAVGVALGAVGAAAPAAAGTTVPATGLTLTAPGITAPAFTGITPLAVPSLGASAALTAPAIAAPTLTGIAGYSELMALGTGAAASVGVPAALAAPTLTGIAGYSELMALGKGAAAAIPVAQTVGTATVAGSGIFTKVLEVAKVASAVTSAGAGMWSEVQKAKIAETMKAVGIADAYQQYIPDGMTSDGNFVYKKAAAVTEIDFKKLALIGGGALLLILLLTGGGAPPAPVYYPPALPYYPPERI